MAFSRPLSRICTAAFCRSRVISARIVIMKTRCTNYLWPLCSLQHCRPHSDVMMLRARVRSAASPAPWSLQDGFYSRDAAPHIQVHWVHSFWCSLFAHFSPLCWAQAWSWPLVTPHCIKYSFYPADTLTLARPGRGFSLRLQTSSEINVKWGKKFGLNQKQRIP